MPRRHLSLKNKLKQYAIEDLVKGHEVDIEGMDEDQRLDILRQILLKSPSIRTQYDILLLQKLTKHIQPITNDEQIHMQCCKQMQYTHGHKDQLLFEMGSKGTRFYIILKGSVGVYLRVGQQQNLVEVSTLTEGNYFGELALLNDHSTRSATVRLKTDCHFAYLDKESYQRILMQKHIQSLKDNIFIFLQIPYFKVWGERDLIRILYRRQPQKYRYKQTIYSQGDSPEQGIFLIKEGLFKIQVQVEFEKMFLDQSLLYDQIREPLSRTANKTVTRTVDILILPSGHSFGEEEAYLNIPRKATVTCESQEALVYQIPLQELNHKVFWDQKVVETLKTHIEMRQLQMQQQINTQTKILDEKEKQDIKQKSSNVILKNITKPLVQSRKIFKLEQSVEFSSKWEKSPSSDFMVPSPQKFRVTHRSQPTLSELKNCRAYLKPIKSKSPVLIQGSQRDIKLKGVIDDLIQRMKDKINGRISKQNTLLDGLALSETYLPRRMKTELPEKIKPRSHKLSLDISGQNFGRTQLYN